MPAWLNGALRAAVQGGWGWVAAYAAAKFGLHLPDQAPAWVDEAVSVAVLAAVVGAIQWLERRSDTTVLGRAARWVARWAMLRLRPAIYPRLPDGYLPSKA